MMNQQNALSRLNMKKIYENRKFVMSHCFFHNSTTFVLMFPWPVMLLRWVWGGEEEMNIRRMEELKQQYPFWCPKEEYIVELYGTKRIHISSPTRYGGLMGR